jgi:hypothetical protein
VLKSVKLRFSSLTFGLIVFGALIETLSIFLPWTSTGSAYGFLPGSPVLNLGLSGWSIQRDSYVSGASMLLRVAVAFVWVGIIVRQYVKNLNVSYFIMLASIPLCFFAALLFIYTGRDPSWGLYSSMAGGVLVTLGVVIGKIKVKPRSGTPAPV